MRDRHEDTLKLRKIHYLNLVHAVAHTLAHTHSLAYKVSPIYTKKTKLKGKAMYLG